MTEPSATALAQLSATAQTLIGGMFITTSLSIMLYGITTTQAYIYWLNFPNDLKVIRRTVLFVWVFETLHTAFCLHLLYNYVITDFGNLSAVSETIWSAGATVVTEVSISAVVQAFFVRRIWILSRKSLLVVVVPAVFLVMRAGMSYGSAIMIWIYDSWSTFDTSLGPRITVTSGLTFAAVTDFCIAVSMIYYLQKNRTGINETDHLIRRLQSYIINTGALTMVASISIVLTFVFLKSSLLFMGLVQVQGKLYANSFLGTLNARARTVELQGSLDPTSRSVELNTRRETTSGPVLGLRRIEVFQHVTSDVNDGHMAPSYRAEKAGSFDGDTAKGPELV